MKFVLALLFLCIFSVRSYASHIAAGQLYYNYLGNNDYEVHLELYRDCSGIPFDETVSCTVFDSAYNVIQVITMTLDANLVQVVDYSTISYPPCLSQASGVCLESFTYSSIINLTPINGGYYLNYQRCCLSNQFINLENSEAIGYTFQCKVPGLETGRYENNSARFTNDLLSVGCLNQTSSYTYGALDVDGDSLVYSYFVPLLHSGDPDPSPEYPPPYYNVYYDMGFSEQDQFGVGDIFVVNSVTAETVINPKYIGMFAFGIEVQEFHGGTLLSSTLGYANLQVVLSDLDITEQHLALGIELKPNPFSSIIEIKAETACELTVFGVDGKVILTRTIGEGNINFVDLSTYTAGIYYFQFRSQNGEYFKKVAKV